MRKRTLIGLMFCALFLSAPAFAQTAQPVIQTAQTVQNDITIPEGTTKEFDAEKGEIKFDGTLTNKGTIIIRSSDPSQAEAILRAAKVVNEGKIISEVPTLTINAESVTGKGGEVTASESIAINNANDLLIVGGTYRANFFRPSTDGKLTIQAKRIDAKVDLKAYDLSIGVFEGHLNVVKQKLDGDPIYYNVGGDVSTVDPGSGFDIWVLAAGNVNLSGVDATGLNGEVRDFVAIAGLHFVQTTGQGVIGCGTFGCYPTIQDFSQPGQILEGDPNTYPPSGTITINGAIARHIDLTARDIVINGTLDARQDNRPGSPSIILTAANSITVNAPLKTEATTDQLKYGSVYLQAPTINVNSKITADAVTIYAFENDVATTGSITTAAIEARTSYIDINGGHIQFGEAGGAFAGGSVLPLSQPHDSGEFTIKTGKLTAHRFINLAATGNIDAGNIELLPNEAPVPLGTHDVRIHANVGKEDAPPLKIGGGTNGAASITVQGTTDLGEGLTQKTGAIFLTNGPSGDIVIDGAKLHVTNEHDGTPSLIAYAGTGQVTVKGNIVLDGTSSAPAGQILLVGDEIRSTGATLSAKDTLSAAADNPAKVVLATSKLTLAGDLTIEANSKALTSVKVVPKGSITLDPQDNFPGIYVYVDKFPINVTEDQLLVAGAGNLTVKAKSDDAKVEITAKPLKFNNGTSEIFATGDGSQINIDYPGAASGANSLIFAGGTVTLNADSDLSDAGTINILADRIVGQEGTPVRMLSRATNTGNGGSISVSAARAIFNDADNQFDASALSSGDGGFITFEIEHRLAFGSAIFTADGFDAGAGGTIKLNPNASLDMSTITSISALGGENGDGGRVELTKPTPFDVNSLIKVESGAGDGGCCVAAVTSTNLLAATGFGGEIKINQTTPENGVTCVEYVNGSGSWPNAFWDCTGNAPSRIQGNAAAQYLPSGAQSKLGQDGAQLYTFSTRQNAIDFFGLEQTAANVSPLAVGWTGDILGTTYSTIFESEFLGNQTKEIETSVHELGHALDYAYKHQNGGLQSTGNLYLTFGFNDFLHLDYSVIGSDEISSTYRDPCSGVDAPLVGVIDDSTGQPFCSNGVLNDPQGVYAGKTNSKILQISDSTIFRNSNLDDPQGLLPGLSELYGQAFAFAAYSYQNVGQSTNLNHKAADTLFNSNIPALGFPYLACTYNWAKALATDGGTPPSVPSYCSNPYPNWYLPFGSKTH